MAGEALKQNLENVPYRSRCYGFSHPAHIGAIALISGFTAPVVATARVLELGCGIGGNLVPMAYSCPRATFVGIDSSAVQISLAKELSTRAGLRNCQFLEHDLARSTPKLEPFDYIIAHGLISWVSPKVREQVMRGIAGLLKPTGFAYLGFNVFPGAHLKLIAREAMRFHTQNLTDPEQRVKGAASFLNFLTAVQPEKDSLYSKLLGAELENVRRQDVSHFLHDYLEQENHPLLFSQFVEEAGAQGLKYVADASAGTLQLDGLSPDAQKQVLALAVNSRERLEQYLDFIVGRGFRQALVCHQALTPLAKVDLPAVEQIFITSPFALRAADAGQRSLRGAELDKELEFSSVSSRLGLKIKDPIGAAVLLELQEVWPSMCSVKQLASKVKLRLGPAAPADFEVRVLSGLVGAVAKGVALVRTENPVPAANTGSVRAHPIAQLLVKERMEVPNFLHQSVVLSDDKRWVLERLDGKVALEKLQGEFEKIAQTGTEVGNERPTVKSIAETLRRYALAR